MRWRGRSSRRWLRTAERERLAELGEDRHGDGLTILFVEHDVAFVMRLADQVTVLDPGRVTADGTADRSR